MTACAQIYALREDGTVFNFDLCQIIDPGILSNPRICADAEPPWKLHLDTGLYYRAGSDPSPERI